jgi:hypothetical protein
MPEIIHFKYIRSLYIYSMSEFCSIEQYSSLEMLKAFLLRF